MKGALLALLLMSTGSMAVDASLTNGFPARLSETGLFTSLAPLKTAPDLVPYNVNHSFWSDGAAKERWLILPRGQKVQYSSRGEWKFPVGSLFVKHFSLGGSPVETRVLMFSGTNVNGATYRWRENSSEADLLATNLTAVVRLHGAKQTTQTWFFPGPEDCRTCHNANAGFILGVNARQLHRERQLQTLSRRGLFDTNLDQKDFESVSALPRDDLNDASLERSARAYLDVNCAFCHRPGGVVAGFDARFETERSAANLIDGSVLFNQGIDGARVIAPGDSWRSILLLRMQTMDGLKMPPLGHELVDPRGVALLEAWIKSLPGEQSVAPPKITSTRGSGSAITVSIVAPDASATIRYTTNGLPPGKSAPLYTGPFEVEAPVTLRARTWKPGYRQSVTVQETFVADTPARPNR